MAKETKKGRVAAAAMSGGSSGKLGAGISSSAIEQAMSAATLEALEKGITDPDVVLQIKLAARERVKASARANLVEDKAQRAEILAGVDKDYAQMVENFAKAAKKKE